MDTTDNLFTINDIYSDANYIDTYPYEVASMVLFPSFDDIGIKNILENNPLETRTKFIISLMIISFEFNLGPVIIKKILNIVHKYSKENINKLFYWAAMSDRVYIVKVLGEKYKISRDILFNGLTKTKNTVIIKYILGEIKGTASEDELLKIINISNEIRGIWRESKIIFQNSILNGELSEKIAYIAAKNTDELFLLKIIRNYYNLWNITTYLNLLEISINNNLYDIIRELFKGYIPFHYITYNMLKKACVHKDGKILKFFYNTDVSKKNIINLMSECYLNNNLQGFKILSRYRYIKSNKMGYARLAKKAMDENKMSYIKILYKKQKIKVFLNEYFKGTKYMIKIKSCAYQKRKRKRIDCY